MANNKAMQFARLFDPEFLSARRDMSKAMLAAAEGHTEVACKLIEENHAELSAQNKDGNTMLLLAAANNHVGLTQKLLELKADAYHKNGMQMDVLDYATMDGIETPMAKAVIAEFEFVAPEVRPGPYYLKSMDALKKLQASHILIARSSILGKTPDFSDILAKETEYRVEWITSLTTMVDTVRRGILLLDADVGYLERDAILGGALEIPQERRFVYRSEDKSLVKFSTALRYFYREQMQQRILEAASSGNPTSVQGLLKAQAQPNVEDVRGQTALMRAAHNGDPQVVNCLIKAKANLNAQNTDGYSAFFLACVSGKELAVRMLLKAKADLSLRSYKGNSAIDFVRHQGHKNILKIITEERERLQDEEKKPGKR
uniref:Ankyrin repeat domain-containing protein n=1 Tax=Alexandrium andersonii TaxID=327968 RepID=A0A7S2N017_9DINO|mmetsp:Transcript_80084/g.179216  ORF Transcript_80084/g.179216 Transcript_80084/m.179216 type:complete len:373 (+) Transcript_80084:56-1174(+)